MIIDGIVYDFGSFDHPGGKTIVELFEKYGTPDQTMTFVSNHSRKFPHNRYEQYKIGTVEDSGGNAPDYSDYLEW